MVSSVNTKHLTKSFRWDGSVLLLQKKTLGQSHHATQRQTSTQKDQPLPKPRHYRHEVLGSNHGTPSLGTELSPSYISVLSWYGRRDKRINPHRTHDFPATNQIEELQGRCIPTSMGSWQPRLRASQNRSTWCGWFIYKHNKLTFDMDQQKSSAKSDFRIKLPGPAKWDTKKTFSTSALKVLWEHPRKGIILARLLENFGNLNIKHTCLICFLYVLLNGAYSL